MAAKIIAIDGFDGTGKTSICRKIEEELGVLYIKPFEKTGEIIKWLHENDQKDIASIVGQQSMLLELSKHDEGIYVCDRNWLSMLVFTGVDIRTEKVDYLDILTISSEERIIEVLEARQEKIDLDNIRTFLPRYKEVASQHGVLTVDTTSKTVEESFQIIKMKLLDFLRK